MRLVHLVSLIRDGRDWETKGFLIELSEEKGEAQVENALHLEVHYYLKNGLHSMDALVRKGVSEFPCSRRVEHHTDGRAKRSS